MTNKTMLLIAALLLPAVRLSAQVDPTQEIKQIAEAVERQLAEIDRLLQESSQAGAERTRPKELLERAIENHKSATDGIEKLIEKLNEMKNQGSSSQNQSQSGQQQQRPDQQQGQPQPQPGEGNSRRRENQTPDFVQQPQPGEQQQGQEQGQPKPEPGEGQPQNRPQGQGQDQPTNGRDQPTGGQNVPGNSPPQDPTGKGSQSSGSQQWGNLPPYLNFLKNRGASPKVPEKFRKYYEAYLKRKTSGSGK